MTAGAGFLWHDQHLDFPFTKKKGKGLSVPTHLYNRALLDHSRGLPFRVLVDWYDVDNDDTGLLARLDVAIRVGDCLEGIGSIDHRAKLLPLHQCLQEVGKRLAAIPQRKHEPAALGDQ